MNNTGKINRESQSNRNASSFLPEAASLEIVIASTKARKTSNRDRFTYPFF